MLFQKKNEQPQTPQLLGEDFDIYPDLDERPAAPAPQAQPEAEEEAEEPYTPEPTPFQQKVAALDEKKWEQYQIWGGVALGGAILFVLFFKPFERFGLPVAVLLALIGPNLLERRAKRRIQKGRTALIVTIALGLVLFVGYTLLLHPEAFRAAS